MSAATELVGSDRQPTAVGAPPDAPLGVVDIGSNSVRLVVFEGASRVPTLLFNEKSLCGLGRRLMDTGQLADAGVACALKALRRYRSITQALEVSALHAVATAAVREAANGVEFVRRAGECLQTPVRVLSGEEEAELSARGVLSGIPDADGIVGDLGGGSLELLNLKHAGLADRTTLGLGPLKLMGEGMAAARSQATMAMKAVPWLKSAKGRSLYLVGGAWRTLARIDMAQRNYPVRVLQQYEIGADRASLLCQRLAGMSRHELEALGEISERRLDVIPYAAMVLEALIAAAKPKRLVVSSYGLREGVHHAALEPALQACDPLLEGARAMGTRYGRPVSLSGEILTFIDPLFRVEAPRQRVLREAAVLLSDIGWRLHPDDRAVGVFHRVLRSQFSGITHPERAFLALTLLMRYGGSSAGVESATAADFLSSEEVEAARILGRALRTAHTLCGHATGTLCHFALELDADALILKVDTPYADFVGEMVERRLAQLASALGVSHRVDTR
ncbi:MAG: Ppx/GppA family phosphatase [Pseudomonadota bacterium]